MSSDLYHIDHTAALLVIGILTSCSDLYHIDHTAALLVIGILTSCSFYSHEISVPVFVTMHIMHIKMDFNLFFKTYLYLFETK